MSLKIYIFSIMLFVFSFNRSSALAQERYNPGSVLVSKEEISGPFFVRQDTYKAGAVLVSRPNPTDTRILDMLNTNGIKTLKDYTRWLGENIKYKRDEGKDIWALPEETLERKCGDCEDFAFLNAAVLSVLGYHPKVLGLNGVRALNGQPIGNHAICVFKKNGHNLYFDNEKLKTTDTSSLDEFAKYMFTHYYCFFIAELEFENKEAKTLLTKYSSKPTTP